MSEGAPLPQDHETLIGQGAHLARWLIGEIVRFLTPQPGQIFDRRYLAWMARHYLVPAEAVLRRAIYLMTETMTLPASRPAAPNRALPPRKAPLAGAPARRPPAPVFRLTETSTPPSTDYTPVHQRPRVSGITPIAAARLANPKRDPATEAAALEARIRRRVAAFQAAFADPERAALRVLRRRAAQPAKPPTLVFNPAPGRKAEPINDQAARILDALDTAVARLADTS